MFDSFFKRPVPKKVTFPRAQLMALASSRQIYGSYGVDDGMKGYHSSLLEPLVELIAPAGLAIYNKMRKNDPVIGGLVLLLESVIKRMDYHITGPNTQFISDMLENMDTPFSQVLGEIASAFTFGFYLGEKIWAMKDGVLTLVDIAPRYQQTIDTIDDDNGMVTQSTGGGTFSIPYSKALHIVLINENRSPFGISILRHLYKPYYYKLSIEASEALSIDRDLGGLPMMTAPEGFDFTAADATSANYDPNVAATLEWAINLVSSVRKDQQQGIVIPFGWAFVLARGENRASVPTSDIIARYNTEMATGILANFISLGAFATTNNANTVVHVANFLGACEAYAKAIADTIQRQIINTICNYNKLDKSPTITLSVKHNNSLKDVGTFLSSMVDKGVIHATPSIEHVILELANLPYNEKEIKEVEDKAEEEAEAAAEAEQARLASNKTEPNNSKKPDETGGDDA